MAPFGPKRCTEGAQLGGGDGETTDEHRAADVKALIKEFMALEQCPGDAAMRIIAVVAAALGFQSVAGLPDLLSTIRRRPWPRRARGDQRAGIE